MRVNKYILALVAGSLALLTNAQLDVAVVQADAPTTPVAVKPVAAKPAERTRRAATKPKPKRVVQLDINVIDAPPMITAPPPVPPPQRESLPPVKRPHVDLEGLLIGDMHVQPNVMFNTDTRYDNAATRERAQRDDLDFLAARQHGDRTRSPDPLGEILRTKVPVTPGSPGSNDPGYEVATAVRDQLYVMPPKPPTPATQAVDASAITGAAAAAAPATPGRTTSRASRQAAAAAAAAKLAKR